VSGSTDAGLRRRGVCGYRPEIDEIARIAHEEVCPYSRATRGNIAMTVTVVTSAD